MSAAALMWQVHVFCSRVLYSYPAWASALLVLTELGNARASESWDEQHVQTPTSFFINKSIILFRGAKGLQKSVLQVAGF